MRSILFTFLFLFLNLCYAQKTKSKTDTTRALDPAADLYKASLKLIDSLRYKDAIKLLDKAVKIKKGNEPKFPKGKSCHFPLIYEAFQGISN